MTDTMRHMGFSEKMSAETDILVTGERKPEGSKIMEQKVYKIMRGAGATNIAIGVVTLVVGIVSGILLIVTGGKLIAGKSKILF